MASAPFVQLASAVVEAMGQRLDAARPTPEGVTLTTSDGFLFSFLEDPNTVSLDTIRHLLGDQGNVLVRLVVLTPGRLPLAFSQEVLNHGGTLVEGARFAELVRQLGLETYLGEEPRPATKESRRLLPSAQQLDAVLHRARTWLDWGVPALSLRFYRQASEMKPGFLPAKVGLGRSLLGLGLVDDADRIFDEVLAARPGDVEARLGKGAVLGARARPKEEVAIYRQLLSEDGSRSEERAHLLAALIDLNDWSGAKAEVEALLAKTPEEPQLRFLHSVALTRTGEKTKGEAERLESRRLGFPYEREVALSKQLGVAPPELPATAEPSRPPGAPAPAAKKAPRSRTRARPSRASRSKKSAPKSVAPRPTVSPNQRTTSRKRK